MNTVSIMPTGADMSSTLSSRKVHINGQELRTLIEDDTHNFMRSVVVIARSGSGTNYGVEPCGPSRNYLFCGDTVRVRLARCLYTQGASMVDEYVLVAITNNEPPAFKFYASTSPEHEETIERTIRYSGSDAQRVDVSGPLIDISLFIDWSKQDD